MGYHPPLTPRATPTALRFFSFQEGVAVLKRWTKREIDVLRENYGKKSLSEIAALVGRSKNSVSAKVKTLRLSRSQPPQGIVFKLVASEPPAEGGNSGGSGRLARLCALRDRIEEAIDSGEISAMQMPAYYREYRATLADIYELEQADERKDGKGGPEGTFAAAIAELAEQQRRYLDQAAVS